MLKRILFSIFSLLVVVTTVMLLVYTLIERSVIFQMDDVWNKKNANDRTAYEYIQYQKFGYLEYNDYASFLKTKYEALYGADYTKNENFKADLAAIQDENTYMENASVQEFLAQNEANGYKKTYLQPVRSTAGKVKKGGNAYLLAVRELSPFVRLWNYITHLITFETTNDVKDEN
jgi:oligopeptide transport system permease protein